LLSFASGRPKKNIEGTLDNLGLTKHGPTVRPCRGIASLILSLTRGEIPEHMARAMLAAIGVTRDRLRGKAVRN
jgi:hypothetical protein